MGGTPGIYNFNSGTHCGRARGQATPCRVSPTPRDSSRGLKRKRQITIQDCTAQPAILAGPKELNSIYEPWRSSSCSSWPLFWLSTVVFSAGTVSFEISEEISSDAIAQTTKFGGYRCNLRMTINYFYWKIAESRE